MEMNDCLPVVSRASTTGKEPQAPAKSLKHRQRVSSTGKEPQALAKSLNHRQRATLGSEVLKRTSGDALEDL